MDVAAAYAYGTAVVVNSVEEGLLDCDLLVVIGTLRRHVSFSVFVPSLPPHQRPVVCGFRSVRHSDDARLVFREKS